MRKSITRVMAFAAVCTIVTGAAFGTQALSRNAKETVQAQTTISREQKKAERAAKRAERKGDWAEIAGQYKEYASEIASRI